MFINREKYIEKIKKHIQTPVIKVIVGMRRTGKSSFLKIFQELLIKDYGQEKDLIFIDKESFDFSFIVTAQDLHNYIKEQNQNNSKKTIIIDEVQEIEEWEKIVSSLLKTGIYDIYITGSNAHLLSSELATYISGRYIEFPIYPLSFKEHLKFRGEKKEDETKEFKRYIKYGGLPILHFIEESDEIIYQHLKSVFNTILLKDIVKRYSIRNVALLEKVANYLFDNIGNITSIKSISDYLKSQKLKIGMETISNYLFYFRSVFISHKAKRYDLKGKKILETNEKFFVNDHGLRHSVIGFRENDISGILENIVYMEFKRRGYEISIGKLDKKEIDFIATKENKKIYIQVTYLLASKSTIEREFKPLIEIKDNYPKLVLSLDEFFGDDYNGIIHKNIIEFLLEED